MTQFGTEVMVASASAELDTAQPHLVSVLLILKYLLLFQCHDSLEYWGTTHCLCMCVLIIVGPHPYEQTR